jgi:hypothetical protein
MMQRLWSEARHDLRQMRGVEQTCEAIADAASINRRTAREYGCSDRPAAVLVATTTIDAFCHEPPMIRVAAANKQS